MVQLPHASSDSPAVVIELIDASPTQFAVTSPVRLRELAMLAEALLGHRVLI